MFAGFAALWRHGDIVFAFFVFSSILPLLAQTKRLHLPAVDTVSLFVHMVIGARVATPFSRYTPLFGWIHILPEYFFQLYMRSPLFAFSSPPLPDMKSLIRKIVCVGFVDQSDKPLAGCAPSWASNFTPPQGVAKFLQGAHLIGRLGL